jgi:hypothetical protein
MTTNVPKRPTVKPLCINLDEMLPFLRSVSYAVVMQRTTRTVWREDEGAVKYLYAAFLGAFGTPGRMEVTTANDAQIRREVEVETQHRIDKLMGKAEVGPDAVARYVASENDIRAYCLNAVREAYADANQVNREIGQAWGWSIEFLSEINTLSTLAVKTMGQIPGPGWAISLGYDVVQGTIEDWSQAHTAQGIVMIASENARKEGCKEAASKIAEKAVDVVNKQPTEKELTQAITRMRQLESKLSRQTDRLAKQLERRQLGIAGSATHNSIRSLSTQVERNAGRLDQAQRGMAKSAGKLMLAKAVGWVFLAKDVTDAIEKHNARTAVARQ